MEPTFYHVTTKSSLDSIKTNGLIPQIDPRSQLVGETESYIYLFDKYDMMEYAVMNWLGEQFDDDEPLICCEIKLPQSIKSRLIKSEAQFEILCPVQIPPQNITFRSL